MPRRHTCERSLGARAFIGVLAAVLFVALIAAPAGADPDPPPLGLEPFPLPMDSGAKWMERQQLATAALRAAQPVLAARQARQDKLEARWKRIGRRIDRQEGIAREARRELDAARLRVQTVAVQAYVTAGSEPMSDALDALTSSDDFVSFGRKMQLMDTYGQKQRDVIADFNARKKVADDAIAVLSEQRAALKQSKDQAAEELADAQAAVDDAQGSIEEALVGLDEFRKAATTAASPIQGPSFLTAGDLVHYVRDHGHDPHLTVGLGKLAQLYIEEGNKAGVRGDVAFAQSILETGWFKYGGKGSLVDNHDNNFAGIGACDSCDHGLLFDTARIGIRAQMQSLRIYTDKDVDKDTWEDEIVLPGVLRLGFRGKVQSWWDLTGTWATADTYGTRVYELYMKMVLFTAERRAEEAEAAQPAGASTAQK